MVKKTDLELAQDHKYVTERGGKAAPGVTTIIGNLAKGDALLYWSAELAAKKMLELTTNPVVMQEIANSHRDYCRAKRTQIKNFQGIKVDAKYATDTEVVVAYVRSEFLRSRNQSRDLGVKIHDNALKLFLGDEVSVASGGTHPKEEPMMNALVNFLDDYSPSIVEAEQIVIYGKKERNYGGRFDVIVQMEWFSGFGNYLLDLKTGTPGFDLEKALQASAYAHSDGIAEFDEDGMLSGARPLPEIVGYGTLYLNEDGYHLVNPMQAISKEDAFNMFLCLRDIYPLKIAFEALERKNNKNDRADSE